MNLLPWFVATLLSAQSSHSVDGCYVDMLSIAQSTLFVSELLCITTYCDKYDVG